MSTKIVDHGDIPIDLIAPNPEQPRQEFDKAGLEELAQSIREQGVIQPIIVELAPDPTPDCRYILHAGERRLRAAKMAGMEVIPAIVVNESSQSDRLARALTENVQRQDMSPLEIARAYARMHDELGLTDQQIADRVGKSRSLVANARRLLDLPADIQELASQEGVSERQLMALLPIYQLPQEALERAEKTYWAKPSSIIQNIRKGQATSNTIREGVASVINNSTSSLNDAVFPMEHEFEIDGLRASRCDQCESCITVGKGKDKALRCPIKSCFQTKSHHWKTEQLQAAIDASGIPALEDGVQPYGETERFYGEGHLAQQILSDGCENLRLKFEPELGSGGLLLPGQHYARVVCHHGEGHKCKCLQRLRTERTRNDPERIAERENQKRLKAEIIEPWSAALAQAIADGQPGVWRRIMRLVSYRLAGKGDGWDLNIIQQKMAESLVNNSLPYDAHDRLGAALSAIQRSFDEMGIPYPGQSTQETAADLRGRLDRIQRWVRSLESEAPAIEAVRGNLDNLEKLTDEFDEVADQHINDERLDGFLQDLADVYERLHELYVLMVNPLFHPDDFGEHGSWLITVPSSDINFKSHLEQASPAVLRYVLVLVDGRENDKTRAEAIKRQLRKLEANGRIVGVQTVEVVHG